ncbi:(citrate (pro-3S)-lyase) ligase [Desulfosporosinus orientis DSM 765]|uniref:[Citrate [pro-3S]-lyase] ligase n=1 Tax=Desulfosporosinus orientis (strain ATCC 19365 / DSM 765 / NCIMB 8382 / VKM B-1628 / Singapore I) TaxID=768706 RepID=G7W9T2_DESOD|nr:[citrate (pro-3S)-lyase] ligase [Desulfosporosinus orientis]AET70648.1 (citrate (pro-3S)-lyase) ligase [Desulfosporosinus orientis DSM 765]
MYGVHVERVNLKSRLEREEVETFLASFDLGFDQDVDYTLVVRQDRPQNVRTERTPIVGTCSKAKNVLKCFAVREEFRGQGIASTLVSVVIDKLFSQGIYHCFVFTKPSQAPIFTALNFKLIQGNESVALLENGILDIGQSLKEMKNRYSIGDEEKAALVMNCNPLTLGHQFLIEEASQNNKEVLIFVVEEEQSLFPFAIRFDLIRRGTAHLGNVKVIPSGEYIISSATFPSYFIREEGEKMKAYADLDASIFGKYFGKYLNIKKRYVGEEPYCPVTRTYNETMKRVLPKYGVELIEIRRKAFEKTAISASLVRSLLKEESPQDLSSYLPEVTLEFLKTSYGKEIAEKIKNSHSPH